jgi:AraC-like DNA-binding protein
MEQKTQASDKGILNAEEGRSNFSLMRYEPSPDLAPFIEFYWILRWNLDGQPPFQQTILSYPNINLSFEQENGSTFTGIYGIPRRTYTRTLQGHGVVIGVKFLAGGFYPFWKQPASQLTGRVLGIRDVLDFDPHSLEQRIFMQEDGASMAQLAEQFLRERLPEPDENIAVIQRIVQAAIDDRDITKVEHITERFGIGLRALQRLFDRYVGVNPKWVIQRYRLQEAAKLLEQGGRIDGSALSQELGFYDQAHFIKQFKAIIGMTPEAYMKSVSSQP